MYDLAWMLASNFFTPGLVGIDLADLYCFILSAKTGEFHTYQYESSGGDKYKLMAEAVIRRWQNAEMDKRQMVCVLSSFSIAKDDTCADLVNGTYSVLLREYLRRDCVQMYAINLKDDTYPAKDMMQLVMLADETSSRCRA